MPMGGGLAGPRPASGRSGSATAAAISAMACHASSPAADPPDEVRLYQHDGELVLDLPWPPRRSYPTGPQARPPFTR